MTQADTETYVLERRFAAPRALVWRCWTDPTLLHRWYGPNIETVIHEYDVAPGGVWLNEMIMGERRMMQRMEFDVVEPETKLVFRQAMAGKDWEAVDNPMMPGWPKWVHHEVTFVEEGDKTLVRLVWSAHDATPEEEAAFNQMAARMGDGWGSGYAVIDEILAELQA